MDTNSKIQFHSSDFGLFQKKKAVVERAPIWDPKGVVLHQLAV